VSKELNREMVEMKIRKCNHILVCFHLILRGILVNFRIQNKKLEENENQRTVVIY
jgi:hypothetical protein